MTTLHHNLSLKDEIRDFWSMRSETFDTIPGHEIFSVAERQAWLALFARHLGLPPQGAKALDLASGTVVDLSHEAPSPAPAADARARRTRSATR